LEYREGKNIFGFDKTAFRKGILHNVRVLLNQVAPARSPLLVPILLMTGLLMGSTIDA
jgi:hypothetical protein